MIFYQNKQNGFSLVETLVAVSILMIVIVGPMSISMRTAKSSSFSSEQIQAFFLAQEGLELAQKGRDDLLLEYFDETNANPWSDFVDETSSGLFHECHAAHGCGLVWSGSSNGVLATPIDCTVSFTSNPCLLSLDTSANRSKFTHAVGGTPTPFTRKIIFETGTNSDEVKVISTVTWRTGSIVADQEVKVSTYLYNIYDL